MPAADKLAVGVLGGMGPDATVDFIAKVVALTPAENDEQHIRLLVDNNPHVPSRQAAILGDGESPGPALADMARGLQRSGADFLVMPCNTAHVYDDAIRDAVDIPFISIIDETVNASAKLACVGLLATAACLQSEIYDRAFASAGKKVILPSEDELAEFTRLLAHIKKGDRGPQVVDGMAALAQALGTRGAEAIIAGCTEIPLVLDAETAGMPLLSSTDLLAEATVAIASGERHLSQTT